MVCCKDKTEIFIMHGFFYLRRSQERQDITWPHLASRFREGCLFVWLFCAKWNTATFSHLFNTANPHIEYVFNFFHVLIPEQVAFYFQKGVGRRIFAIEKLHVEWTKTNMATMLNTLQLDQRFAVFFRYFDLNVANTSPSPVQCVSFDIALQLPERQGLL